MAVGGDGVAVITLENPPVNAMHPTGTLLAHVVQNLDSIWTFVCCVTATAVERLGTVHKCGCSPGMTTAQGRKTSRHLGARILESVAAFVI